MVVASCLRFCSLQVVPLVAPSIEPGPTVKAHVHTKEEPKQAGQIHVEDPTLTVGSALGKNQKKSRQPTVISQGLTKN